MLMLEHDTCERTPPFNIDIFVSSIFAVNLVWSNAMLYNQTGSEIYKVRAITILETQITFMTDDS
jgi:hypothetical protein